MDDPRGSVAGIPATKKVPTQNKPEQFTETFNLGSSDGARFPLDISRSSDGLADLPFDWTEYLFSDEDLPVDRPDTLGGTAVSPTAKEPGENHDRFVNVPKLDENFANPTDPFEFSVEQWRRERDDECARFQKTFGVSSPEREPSPDFIFNFRPTTPVRQISDSETSTPSLTIGSGSANSTQGSPSSNSSKAHGVDHDDCAINHTVDDQIAVIEPTSKISNNNEHDNDNGYSCDYLFEEFESPDFFPPLNDTHTGNASAELAGPADSVNIHGPDHAKISDMPIPSVEKLAERSILSGPKTKIAKNPYRLTQAQKLRVEIASGIFTPPTRITGGNSSTSVASHGKFPQHNSSFLVAGKFPSVSGQGPQEAAILAVTLENDEMEVEEYELRDLSNMSEEEIKVAYRKLEKETARTEQSKLNWIKTAKYYMGLLGRSNGKMWLCNNHVGGKKCAAKNAEWVPKWIARENCQACGAAKLKGGNTCSSSYIGPKTSSALTLPTPPSPIDATPEISNGLVSSNAKKRHSSEVWDHGAQVLGSAQKKSPPFLESSGSNMFSPPATKRSRVHGNDLFSDVHGSVATQGTFRQPNSVQQPITVTPSQASRAYKLGLFARSPSLSQGGSCMGASPPMRQHPPRLSPEQIRRGTAMGLISPQNALPQGRIPMGAPMTTVPRGAMPKHSEHISNFADIFQQPVQGSNSMAMSSHQQAAMKQIAMAQAAMKQTAMMQAAMNLTYMSPQQQATFMAIPGQQQAVMNFMALTPQQQANIMGMSSHQPAAMNNAATNRGHGSIQSMPDMFSTPDEQQFIAQQSPYARQIQQNRLAQQMASSHDTYQTVYEPLNQQSGYSTSMTQQAMPHQWPDVHMDEQEEMEVTGSVLDHNFSTKRQKQGPVTQKEAQRSGIVMTAAQIDLTEDDEISALAAKPAHHQNTTFQDQTHQTQQNDVQSQVETEPAAPTITKLFPTLSERNPLARYIQHHFKTVSPAPEGQKSRMQLESHPDDLKGKLERDGISSEDMDLALALTMELERD